MKGLRTSSVVAALSRSIGGNVFYSSSSSSVCAFSFTAPVMSASSSSSSSKASSTAVTPDFTTTVNVGDIKLTKPKGPPGKGGAAKIQKQPTWEGMEGLASRTEGSLVGETLIRMDEDVEFQQTAAKLKELGQKKITMEERKRRRRALEDLGQPDFKEFIKQRGLTIARDRSTILQLNIGLYCNQACNHCHVESSPKRTEMMSRGVADQAIKILMNSPGVTTLDITGGAPELNSEFRYLVEAVTKYNRQRADEGLAPIEVIDRCNLTVLLEPGQEDLAQFLADNKVRVVASLPCYSVKNVDSQRGSGVFDRSIAALRKLNSLGYGAEGSGLSLDLVYNPLGAFLPPPQGALEEKYKEELLDAFGITFNGLFTITNMPIKRFADFLYRRGELSEYMDLLVRNFNDDATKGIMCKNTISVGWDGSLYDCDFNQQLALGMGTQATATGDLRPSSRDGFTIFDVDSVDQLYDTGIVLESHCFGCTAGMGSSCQGATA